ncbi:unnamed protein product [Urochloa humidicola]
MSRPDPSPGRSDPLMSDAVGGGATAGDVTHHEQPTRQTLLSSSCSPDVMCSGEGVAAGGAIHCRRSRAVALPRVLPESGRARLSSPRSRQHAEYYRR